MRTMQHIRTHTMYAPLPGCVKKSIFRRFGLVPPTIPGGLCFTEGVQTKHSPGCGKELHDAKREECCRSGCGRGGVTLFLALFWWRRTTTRVCVCVCVLALTTKLVPFEKRKRGGRRNLGGRAGGEGGCTLWKRQEVTVNRRKSQTWAEPCQNCSEMLASSEKNPTNGTFFYDHGNEYHHKNS